MRIKIIQIIDNWYHTVPWHTGQQNYSALTYIPPLVKCKNLMFSGFMVSLEQVSQYTVISPWNSMITPAVKWFVNGDIMTTNKLPGMYYFFF